MMAPDRWRAEDNDAVLDGMLASWAARHAPTAERLEVIRRSVLDEAAAAGELGVCEAVLPLEWWERFFADLQAGLRRAASLDAVLAA
jgi:hypothetical protein